MFSSKPFKFVALFSLISLLFGEIAHAALMSSQGAPTPHSFTVNTEMELQKRIEFSEPKSYEEIQDLFRPSPVYSARCVPEEDVSSQPREEALALFEKFTLKNPRFLLNFQFKEQDLGFDVALREELKNGEEEQLEQKQFTDKDTKDSLLGCNMSPPKEEDKEKKTHTCASLSMARLKKIRIENENYDPEASLEETWTIFPASKDEMYARLMLEYTATELDWMSRKAGSISMSQHWICLLKSQDSN